MYKQQSVNETWPKDFYNPEELFPLKKYKFASISISGAFNPKPYLERLYGKDWNKIAYREYDHELEKEVEKIKVRLTKEDRVPAKPFGIKKRHCS